MKKLFNLKNNDKGQSMVEFALVLPILMLLVVGIIQFGLIFNVKITLANEAREAVRYSAVSAYNDDKVKEKIKESLKDNSLLAKYVNNDEVEIEISPDLADRGDQVTVKITIREFDLIVMKKPYKLDGMATMRIEPENASNGVPGNQPSLSYQKKLENFNELYTKIEDAITWANVNDNHKTWFDNGGHHMQLAEPLYYELLAEKRDFVEDLKKIGTRFQDHFWKDFQSHYSNYLKHHG